MDPEDHGNSINIDTFGIAGSHYGPDIGSNSFGQGLFANTTWPLAGVNPDEMTISPELGPILHTESVPNIFITGSFSLDSIGLSDISPASFTGNGFFESPIQEHPNNANWDTSSLLSDSTYQIQRSLSFTGTTDAPLWESWNDQMTASPTHLHPHSLPNSFETPFYNPANKTESVSSVDSLMEITGEPMQAEMIGDASNPPALTFFDVTPSTSTGAMVAKPTAGGKKPRGRHGHLNERQREAAAKMRKIGACKVCRDRKARCDGNAYSIYCTACIKYYKGKGGTLPPQPCRGSGRVFESLAEVLMKGHVFPKNRPLEQYLGNQFKVENQTYTIHINLGFGAPFEAAIKLVKPEDNDKLVHRHISYPWQPEPTKTAKKQSSRDFVFPAILANPEILPRVLENHIAMLLDTDTYFRQFPLYKSELEVLRQIYIYYLSLPEDNTFEGTIPNGRTTLRQALKLLVLVHIGGDTKLDDKCYRTSHEIISRYFPETQDSETAMPTPCFIRGQLGPIFALLAKRLMKDVLARLEALAGESAQHFPVILSTFAVLFMAVETIQYHAAKESYHASYDSESIRNREKIHVLANEEEGVENLLNFYSACFGNCHANLHERSASGFQRFANDAAKTGNGFESDKERTVAYLKTIKAAIDRARFYLVAKKDGVGEQQGLGKGDMSVYFDRLLAKLFLTRA